MACVLTTVRSADTWCCECTGCPDLYRLNANTHMFQGVLRPLTSLLECQRACLEERNCLGVDWNKLDSDASTADSQRCYFVYPESTRYGVQPAGDYCCDHYRRTYCLSTAVPHPDGDNTTTTTTDKPSWPQQQYASFIQAPQCTFLVTIHCTWIYILHRVRKKRPRYFRHTFYKFRRSFVIFWREPSWRLTLLRK